jgi:hypothetical protein
MAENQMLKEGFEDNAHEGRTELSQENGQLLKGICIVTLASSGVVNPYKRSKTEDTTQSDQAPLTDINSILSHVKNKTKEVLDRYSVTLKGEKK